MPRLFADVPSFLQALVKKGAHGPDKGPAMTADKRFNMTVCVGAAFADDRIPTGTLRATYIATNPVQAFVDLKSGELHGPGADVAREIARRLNAPVKITGVAGPAAAIDSVRKGKADIGFLAFDPLRAAEVDFSQVYALARNSYIVEHIPAVRVLLDERWRKRRVALQQAA